jgi:nicotinamidase-related amidase
MVVVPDGLPLVVIDIVKGCCNEEYEIPEWDIHFSKVREMLPQLNAYVKKHRENGGEVIWIKPVPWTEEHLSENINKLYRENPDATFYVTENIEEYDEFPDSIDVDPEDAIIVKNNYSAFTNPILAKLLKTDYLVCGVYADGCVNATIIDGWGRGYFPYILSDLVESMDAPVKQDQKNSLLACMWPLMYGHVIK